MWLVQSGRGFGKTRVGAQWICAEAEAHPGWRFALVAETAADARDVMIEGDSGILACSPPWFYPKYEPSKRRLTWPNGAQASTFSGDEPGQLRGPQFNGAWADELAKWRYAEAAWDNLEFGLRLGDKPQVLVTTTPRNIDIIKKLRADPDTVVTLGHTNENRANLSQRFVKRVIGKYEGTRLGRQELAGEVLDDNPGALWKRADIDALRVSAAPLDLVKVIVGVDPQAAEPKDQDKSKKGSEAGEDQAAETGIIAVGLGRDGHGYVLDDASIYETPNGWGTAVVNCLAANKGDLVVAEINNGGAMVEFVVQTVANDLKKTVPYKAVHASRGKEIRAQPVAALYEQKRVHHVGSFSILEDQMCQWEPGEKSPDRMDALVWALTELMVDKDEPPKSPMTAPPLMTFPSQRRR